MGKRIYLCKSTDDISEVLPNEVINDEVCKISEDKMITNYPNIYCYLLNNKDNLLRRKRDKGSQWFEYGRNQAIKGIFTIKLLISTVVTNNVKVHGIRKGRYCIFWYDC